MSGAFITVEGVDGAGKTTQLKFIDDWFMNRGVKVVRTREPGGTAFGDAARKIMLGGETLCAPAELLLVFAARAQNLFEVIEPALAAGEWVICDRFTDSTFAYQGGGRGINMKTIAWLEEYVQGARRPDLTFALDVSREIGGARIRERGASDHFDERSAEYQNAVRKVFALRAEKNTRMHLIDAARDINTVRADIATLLENFWNARGET